MREVMDLDLRFRLLADEAFQHRRHACGDRPKCRNAQNWCHRMCIRDMTDVGDRGEGASRGLQDVVARWRELQPPPRALEEYAYELLLEFVPRPRDRGLGDGRAKVGRASWGERGC